MLSDRQTKILFAIVEQYAEVAAPVGSVTLSKLFNVSSATIRSEMAALEDLGYLEQTHISSGRIPTDKGYRTYVNSMIENNPNLAPRASADRALNARISSSHAPEKMIRSTVDTLVELTNNLCFATIGGQIYMSGLSHLFGHPDFIEPTQVRSVAALLDNIEPWLREVAPNEALNVYIGSENPIGRTSGCSLIISKFDSPYSHKSYIGVLGPKRQSYRQVISLVEHAGKTLQNHLIKE